MVATVSTMSNMSSGFARTLTIVCAVGSGLLGGVFFTFSTFVMSGLRRIPAPAGITAMQSINRQAPTPPLMLLLLGTSAACVVLAVVAIVRWGSTTATLALIGALLAIVPMVLTGTYHVPRNDALALVDPNGPEAAEAWRHYLAQWVPWNHLRTLASLAGATLLTISLRTG
jgi:uncharacterized membrane protein